MTEPRTPRLTPRARARRLARAAHPASIEIAGRRLLAAIPVLLGVSVLTFVVVDVLPGNAARQLLGAEATPAQVARLAAELDLDRPAWARYVGWLGGALEGDLGRSIASGRPVTALVGERLPVTLEIVAYAFVLALATAVPAALWAASRPGGIADRVGMALGMAGLSCASYVLALVLILVFAVHWGLFPSIGFASLDAGIGAHVRSLTLPSVAIAFPLSGFYARYLRGDLVEQMSSKEYIVAARAKGLHPSRILIRHALPNALFGLLTVVGLHVGTLIGGTVVIEQIFALPGIGRLLLESIELRDVVVVEAVVLVLAAATVLANLGVDLLYAALDPRIRYARR